MKFFKKYKKCLVALISIIIILCTSVFSAYAGLILTETPNDEDIVLSCPSLNFSMDVYDADDEINGNKRYVDFNITDVGSSVRNLTLYYNDYYESSDGQFRITGSYYKTGSNYMNPVNILANDVTPCYYLTGSTGFQHLVNIDSLAKDQNGVSYVYFPKKTTLTVNDFYSWTSFDSDDFTLGTEIMDSGSQFSIQFFQQIAYGYPMNSVPDRCEIWVTQVGKDVDELLYMSTSDFSFWGIEDYKFEFDFPFWFSNLPDGYIDNSLPHVFHIKSVKFTFNEKPVYDDVGMTVRRFSFNTEYDFDPRFSGFYDYYFDYLVPSSPDVPVYPQDDFPLMPFANWLGGAVSGFLDLQLFPGFTLGGIFVTLFAFTCVVWFLKLVAGG